MEREKVVEFLINISFLLVLNKINENIYHNIGIMKKVKEMDGEWVSQVTDNQTLSSMFEHDKDAKESAKELAPSKSFLFNR